MVLIGNNEIFVEMENVARMLGLQINKKSKYVIVERKKTLKQNTGHPKIKNH
jgi:sugar diacid utilization regulator